MIASFRANFGAGVAVSLALGAAVLAGSGRAHASPRFPAVMSESLGLDCEPSCALCHKGETGFGTTNTPFGMKMRREASLRCCNDDALADALALFQERGIDTDADGTPDVDELIAGSDPNGEGALACERRAVGDGSRILGEGCSAAAPRAASARRTGTQPGTDATAFLLTAALVGLVVRVRTRRAR